MKIFKFKLVRLLQPVVALAAVFFAAVSSAVTIPNQPLSIQQAATPMIMLGFGRDHRLYYEAYNDASDIDGDGTIDLRFKPFIEYLGLFDSALCYSHNNSSTMAGVFTPTALATTATISIPAPTIPNPANTRVVAITKCSGGWSGNWLNYITTSRIDALRVVLYGGMRNVDSSTETVIQRAYIPQDAHSWAKEYTSASVDGYKIGDYTPLNAPTTGNRHFFGNLTPNATTNCDPIANCSGLAPWLSVVTNSNKRVWEWASTERPVLADNTHGGTRTNRTVRVKSCVTGFITSSETCQLYPNGSYKPVGVLHKYGDTDKALFGLFTGSYDSNMSGGRLRKVMSTFRNEINSADGTFVPSMRGIVHNFNQFRLYAFNRGRTDQIYNGSVIGDRAMRQGEFPDWGNPIGELMYEATRYLANKGTPTPAYINDASNNAINTVDDLLGLSRPAWDRPYAGQGTSTANAPYCAKASLLTISDTNISFDSDQLPGVDRNFNASTFATDLTGTHIVNKTVSALNVSLVTKFISANEPGVDNSNRFIGQSGASTDSAPTAKAINSLATIRGIAPEEPTKQGSYYSAAVAHFARVNDLNAGLPDDQTVDNFVIALASPLLRIQAPLPNGRVISILPIGKSISGAFGITPGKTAFQPTNQIVDFYVESVANSNPSDYDPAINGGLYEAKFRINFEDVEQGNDHDMDAIVLYTVRVKGNSVTGYSLDVITQPLYEAGGVNHRMGYIISGTTRDGMYLTVQDAGDTTPYFLNVPPGRTPGYCDVVGTPQADCNRLPFTYGTAGTATSASLLQSTLTTSIFNFRASAAGAVQATYLNDPLWYAAKWGGFVESKSSATGIPDNVSKWDSVDNKTGANGFSDGQPDNYLLVQNPTSLRSSLKRAIEKIIEEKSSASNLQSNATGRIDTNTLIYRASYEAGSWSGEVEAFSAGIAGVGKVPAWKASEQLPAWTARKLFMNDAKNVMINITSTPFSSLNVTDTASLTSESIYSFIKGDRSKEVASGGTLRNRKSALGDIIHSSPAFDLDSKTLYFGGNGGFLHAFNGDTGVEKFAVMPQEVVPRVRNIASLAYPTSHEYFVDGASTIGLKVLQSSNNYYLYTLLGRGGKGLFSINPGPNGDNPALLWEYTPRAGAIAAATSPQTSATAILAAAATDQDLGFMLSRPAPVLLKNGKLGLMVGNGYNSTSGKAVVYIFMMNQDGSLFGIKKLDSGVAGDNGMAGPAASDYNNDGVAEFIYAGDLKGNLWKFNVSDPDPTKWGLAIPGGVPMFKATDSQGNPQPITAPITPVYDESPAEKLFLFFGTGSYFKSGDTTDMSVQSWYGIIDDDTGINNGTAIPSVTVGTVTTSRGALTKRMMSDLMTGSITDLTATPPAPYIVRYGSGEVKDDMKNKRGWFYDFDNPKNGERVTEASQFLRNTSKPVLQALSYYPTGGQCEPGGETFENVVDPFTGANMKEAILLRTDPQPTEKIGPEVSNPNPLGAGLHNAKLWPSSRKLNIGIGTEPINLTSSGSAQSSNYWLPLGITYGSPSNSTANSDFRRYQRAVAVRGNKEKDCGGNLITISSGSGGITGQGLAGCSDARLRGRISWREILKD